jgi:hypothetical protein
LQVLLFSVFVVAVAFGTWFFGYGLSLLGAVLEPRVPDAPRDATQEKRPQAAEEVQVGRLPDLSTTAITVVAKPGTRLDEPRDA